MTYLLETKNLTVKYKNLKDNSLTCAVDGVNLKVDKSEIYAIAGESGSGKSTLAKTILKLIKPVSGEILYKGKNINKQIKAEQNEYRKNVQMIFQNPYSSLNPRMKIGDILREPLDINTKFSNKKKEAKVLAILDETGLPQTALNLYPHEFSGGQRQRIAIARALILEPEFIVADEPVSALDASIQAQILNLLKDLKLNRNLTILFISHDMNVIKYISDRVGIMCNGKIVEENYTKNLFRCPREEYTKKLIDAIPLINNLSH